MTHDQETVLLQGHIIDSLILAKVLDRILMMGGTFDIQYMQIGKTRQDQRIDNMALEQDSLLVMRHTSASPH